MFITANIPSSTIDVNIQNVIYIYIYVILSIHTLMELLIKVGNFMSIWHGYPKVTYLPTYFCIPFMRI